MSKEKSDQALRKEVRRKLEELGVAAPQRVIEEFDLLTISEEKEGVTRQIAKKISDRIETHAQLFEGLLQPDTNITAMNEIGFFTEKEHEMIARSYRRLMRLLRTYTLASLEASEEGYEQYVKSALEEWEAEKEHLRFFLERLCDRWGKEEPLQTERSYFG